MSPMEKSFISLVLMPGAPVDRLHQVGAGLARANGQTGMEDAVDGDRHVGILRKPRSCISYGP